MEQFLSIKLFNSASPGPEIQYYLDRLLLSVVLGPVGVGTLYIGRVFQRNYPFFKVVNIVDKYVDKYLIN